ncbi:hypothetical protein SAMN05216174_1287 [Actinokineospora iranica]|uniref:Uncharacterized protein n=1 Tax=Actinokineospora iranica TaxID=1271860 RepID=A0A1G6ZC04_9PSEU|nr:hypothetical protein SAMN05216174_1287 [Actinokineospora iranica]
MCPLLAAPPPTRPTGVDAAHRRRVGDRQAGRCGRRARVTRSRRGGPPRPPRRAAGWSWFAPARSCGIRRCGSRRRRTRDRSGRSRPARRRRRRTAHPRAWSPAGARGRPPEAAPAAGPGPTPRPVPATRSPTATHRHRPRPRDRSVRRARRFHQQHPVVPTPGSHPWRAVVHLGLSVADSVRFAAGRGDFRSCSGKWCGSFSPIRSSIGYPNPALAFSCRGGKRRDSDVPWWRFGAVGVGRGRSIRWSGGSGRRHAGQGMTRLPNPFRARVMASQHLSFMSGAVSLPFWMQDLRRGKVG